MNIDDQVNGLVQNILSEITTKVQTQVARSVEEQITAAINKIDTTALMTNLISQKLDAKISQLPIDSKNIETVLQKRVESIANTVSASVQTKAIASITESVNAQVNRIDFQQVTQAALSNAIKNQSFKFEPGTIPAIALNTEDWALSGNNIKGGIITNFGSTGIDDRSTACQLTILDDITVVENNLLTKDLTVKGTINIEGDLNVLGHVPDTSPMYINLVKSISDTVKADVGVFAKFTDTVVEKIKQDGIDLNKFSVNGQEIVNGKALSNSLTESNLQKVGQLRELQVTGETLLSGSLYSTVQRVGINTVEPSQALSIWDQEVEIGFGKKTSDTAIIGTPRAQALILSSNNKNNLTVLADGSVAVNKLMLGSISLAFGDKPPSDTQPKGSIVFNANPSLGGPMGWVSLGNAQWANFGVID